jgi:hypothetical protein
VTEKEEFVENILILICAMEYYLYIMASNPGSSYSPFAAYNQRMQHYISVIHFVWSECVCVCVCVCARVCACVSE